MKKIVLILAIALCSTIVFSQVAEKQTVFNVVRPNKVIAVSPAKMNILYVGVDNPVDIAICDVPAKYITATIDSGSIESLGDGKFNVKVGKGYTYTKINVFETYNGKSTKIGEKLFRVKTVPDPIAYIGGVRSGILNKNVLAASQILVAKLDNFDFDLTFKITSFTFLMNVKGDIVPIVCSGNMLTVDIINKISNATSGSRIYFEDIKALGPDGSIRSLSPINIKIL
jgi:gliding motility-associated protein GldM